MRDVRHELRAHLLEPAKLGDVVQHHDHTRIVGGQPQGHGIGLHGALDGAGHAELAADDGPLAAQPALADQLVQPDVTDDLQQGRAFGPRRVQPEDRARPLVHEDDVPSSIDGQHALDHAVEDRPDLGPLVLEILEPVAEPPGQHVEGPGQHADLVGRAHRRPGGEVALTHLARDGLHLNHGVRHPSGHEHADGEGDEQGQESADEHDPVDRSIGRRHRRQRQRQTQHRSDAIAIAYGKRDVEQRLVDGHAPAQVAADAPGQRRPHLRTLGVILDTRQRGDRHLGIAEHATVEGDQRDARARGLARAHRERAHGVRTGVPRDQPARVAHQEPGRRCQARFQRLDREGLQRLVEIEPGRDQRHADEADQREGELERNAATDGRYERAQHHSSSSR